MDERKRSTVHGITHVLFIIQLPRVAGGTSFTSFQGGPWISAHIDQLTCPSEVNQVVKCALSEPLHKFFLMLIENDNELSDDFRICCSIKDNVQVAVSRIVSNHTNQQMERVIDILLKGVADKVPLETGQYNYD